MRPPSLENSTAQRKTLRDVKRQAAMKAYGLAPWEVVFEDLEGEDFVDELHLRRQRRS